MVHTSMLLSKVDGNLKFDSTEHCDITCNGRKHQGYPAVSDTVFHKLLPNKSLESKGHYGIKCRPTVNTTRGYGVP